MAEEEESSHQGQGEEPRTKFRLKPEELIVVFHQIKRILDKDVLTMLDIHATDVYTSAHIRHYPYKTVSECMMLVCVTLLRDVLQPYAIHSKKEETGLTKEFFQQVRKLVNQLFLDGQTELSGKQPEPVDRDRTGREIAVNKGSFINRMLDFYQ